MCSSLIHLLEAPILEEQGPSIQLTNDLYMFLMFVLTQNLHLTPSTQQAEQASFTREEIPRRASQFFPEN
jgi:hypothetical protein